MDKRINKMDKETLEQFMAFRKRGYYLKNKKGKGSYDRKKFKQGVAQETKRHFFKKTIDKSRNVWYT